MVLSLCRVSHDTRLRRQNRAIMLKETQQIIAVMRRVGMRIEENPYADPPWLQVVGSHDLDDLKSKFIGALTYFLGQRRARV